MNKEFLYEMLKTPSPSGDEVRLQRKVKAYMDKYATTSSDVVGNVYSIINEDAKFSILLAGHIDEIGLMVVNFTESGMLKVINTGGVRTKTYLGQKVRILANDQVVYGCVGINKGLNGAKDLKVEELFIDIGATSKSEAMAVVSHGDYVILDTDFHELLNDCITARAMDDRIGAFIILEALIKAKEKGTKHKVIAATTCGEESSMRGAFHASVINKPDCAVVVDVTFASDYPGVGDEVYGDIKINGGPVICNSSVVNRKLNEVLKQAAKNLNMSIQYEGATGRTGTDGDKILFTNQGVPITLVSIPLRYMHSPSEMGSLKDIQECIDLIAEFLVIIDSNTSLKPLD